jgi:predicted MFS family arabinose efflux permease
VEARTRTSMVPLTLFRSHTFSGTNLLTFTLYGAMGSLTFFLPFNLIQVQGYSPTDAALAFVPFALMMFLLSRWTGGLVNRLGAKLPLIIGPVVVACGFVLFALPGITEGAGQYWITFFPAVLVVSIGMSITVPPLTTAVLGAVEKRHAGIASGINNAVARVAGLLAIAVLGIVVLAAFKISLDSQFAALHLSPALRALLDGQSSKLADMTIPTTVSGAVHASLKRAIDVSFVTSFRLVALICAALALASAGSALLLVEGKSPTTPSPS